MSGARPWPEAGVPPGPYGGADQPAARLDHGADRRQHRQRRAADDRVRPRRDPVAAAVDDRGVPARVRGRARDRLAARRRVRPQAAVRRRPGRLHRDVGRVRAGPRRRLARRVPRAAGLRGGGDDPAGDVEHPGALRARGAGEGDGRVQRAGRPRDRARPGAGRDPHRRRHRRYGVAAGLPHQRPGRRAGAGGGAAVHPRVALGPPAQPRPGRRADARRGAAGRALPADDGPRAGLARVGLRADGGRCGRAGPVRPRPAPGRAGGSRAAGRAQPLPRPRVRRRQHGADGAVRLDVGVLPGADGLLPGRPRLVGAQGRAGRRALRRSRPRRSPGSA